MEYYSAIKNNEILSFASTWMDVKNIMLSVISQIEKEKYCIISLTYGILKIIQTNVYRKQETDSHRKQTSCQQMGDGKGDGQVSDMGLRAINYYV